MTAIEWDVNPGQRYRVWAAIENDMAPGGVVVAFSFLESDPSVTIHFATRDDAERFFRTLVAAVLECGHGECGTRETIMAEGVATSWDAIEAEGG